MKIFLPIHLKKTGGTSRFAQNIQQQAAVNGHQVIFDYQPHYDALLVVVSCPLRYLIDAKRRGKPIIHRLDGTYYKSTIAGHLYPLYNMKAKLIQHRFADFTIYQSQYSKYCCDIFLGAPRPEQHRIIYNGVDINHFTPDGTHKNLHDNPQQHVFITWSRFRRPDQILPILAAYQAYRTEHPNSKLIILGNFADELANIADQQIKQVEFIGPIEHRNLPSFARGADLFVISHQNPPCPNNVLEAMALGLPICGVDDGAMSELTTPGLNSELINTSGDSFDKPRDLDTDAFADNMNKIMQNRSAYSLHSRRLAQRRFRLDEMVNNYLAVFESVITSTNLDHLDPVGPTTKATADLVGE